VLRRFTVSILQHTPQRQTLSYSIRHCGGILQSGAARGAVIFCDHLCGGHGLLEARACGQGKKYAG
jgi:hypothetical protein